VSVFADVAETQEHLGNLFTVAVAGFQDSRHENHLTGIGNFGI